MSYFYYLNRVIYKKIRLGRLKRRKDTLSLPLPAAVPIPSPRPQRLAEVQTRFLAARKLLVVPYLAGTRPRRDGVVVNPQFRTGVAVRPDHDQSGGVRLRQHASEVYSGTHIDLCGAAAAGKCATTYFTTVFRQPSNPIC